MNYFIYFTSVCVLCALSHTLSVAFIIDISLFSLFLYCLEGQKACSCYTFKGELTSGILNWERANESCEATNEHLVVMETEREWQFITDKIGKLNTKYNEWHIGLFNASGSWTWINGEPLTKWQKTKWHESEPAPDDRYGLIHKSFPPGSNGTFSGNKGVSRDYICEQETGKTKSHLGLL